MQQPSDCSSAAGSVRDDGNRSIVDSVDCSNQLTLRSSNCSTGSGSSIAAPGSSAGDGSSTHSNGQAVAATVPRAAHEIPETRATACNQWQRLCARFEKVDARSFDVLEHLGEGNFGLVCKVSHKVSARTFAMKVLPKENYRVQDLRCPLQELSALAPVSHSFIAALHYAFQTPTQFVLVMEYCCGGSLQELLNKSRKLYEPLARHYTAEVLMALEYLHARQVMHRDLKAENVMLDENRHAKLVDFGLAKENADCLSGGRSFVGTLCFLAPEIVAKLEHGFAVDVYNLGTLLFYMISGKTPFHDSDTARMKQNIRQAQLIVPSNASSDCRSFIEQTMSRDPRTRCGEGGTEQLRKHAFLSTFDWDALLSMQVPVPRIGERHRRIRRPLRGLRCFKPRPQADYNN